MMPLKVLLRPRPERPGAFLFEVSMTLWIWRRVRFWNAAGFILLR